MTGHRWTAPEVIAYFLGWDMADVSAGRYQSTTYARPAVYVCGEDYYCCPHVGGKPPKDFDWVRVGEEQGRTVYKASGTASAYEGAGYFRGVAAKDDVSYEIRVYATDRDAAVCRVQCEAEDFAMTFDPTKIEYLGRKRPPVVIGHFQRIV